MVSPPTHHCVPCGTPPTQPNMLDSLFCIYSTFFNIQQCLGEARGSRAFFFYAKTAARAVKTASSAVSEERRVVPNARPGVVSERTANAVSERAANVVSERAADAVSERAANVVSERAANAVSERAAKSAKKSPACAGDLSFACENYFLRFSSKAFSMSASSLGSVPSLSNLE